MRGPPGLCPVPHALQYLCPAVGLPPFLIHAQMYADDMQVLFEVNSAQDSPYAFLVCLKATKKWMNTNYFCLNEVNTEIMWLCIPPASSLSFIWPTETGPPCTPVKEVKNLECLFDSQLNFSKQIATATQAATFKRRTLRKILPLFKILRTEATGERVGTVLHRPRLCHVYGTSQKKSLDLCRWS